MNLKVAVPQGMGLDVLTDKPVTYKVGGESPVTGASIYHEGKLLHPDDEILIVPQFFPQIALPGCVVHTELFSLRAFATVGHVAAKGRSRDVCSL